MQRSDFHFDLPEALIAQAPLAQRTASRLLYLNRKTGQVQDQHFTDLLSQHIRPDDLLVFNNTKVMPARLFGHKSTGGKLEILIERVTGKQRALAHIRASKSPKPHSFLTIAETIQVEVCARHGALFELEFQTETSVVDILEQHGHMPLPPYIQREDTLADKQRYQTVYAEQLGAVAAPTAGLHFDTEMLAALDELGAQQAFVTLHVGAGTFQPVRVDDLSQHPMHSEWLSVSHAVVEQVKHAKQQGGRVIAVGTTSVRALESAAADGVLTACEKETQLFITPSYQFRVIDGLITNFHLSESTLLMLVSAFAGHAEVMSAYQHAVAQKYRFFSYGDAMLLL